MPPKRTKMSKSSSASSSESCSIQLTLKLVDLCLENAQRTMDTELALELSYDAEAALSRVKGLRGRVLIASKKDETLSKRIATSYINLGTLQEGLGRNDKAHANFKKAVQWGGDIKQPSLPNNDVESGKPAGGQEEEKGAGAQVRGDTAPISQDIFTENVSPPAVVFTPPQPDERLSDIRQLAACLSLLHPSRSSDDDLEPTARDWLKAVENNPDEQERLWMLATEVIREFVGDDLKDVKAIAEVLCLAPVLDHQNFRFLLRQFYSGVEQSDLLDIGHLQGLADLIQGADPGYLDSDDLVKILELLSAQLSETHHQSPTYTYRLTIAISHVLDAMADARVNGLDRKELHTPLGSYLDKLQGSSDPYLVYQAAYAYQALLYVPNNETPWQAALRRIGQVIQGVSGLVSAAKGLDLNRFMEGLGCIQKGMTGASTVLGVIKTAVKDASSLVKGGTEYLDNLKEDLSFDRKQAWYPALRGMDILIRDGHLVKFKTLVCEAPCRNDPAFQWGVCQRLGEIAANSLWGADTRRGAISFLGELHRNGTEWGTQAEVKQWTLTILTQLSSFSGSVAQYAAKVLEELSIDGNTGKQAMSQSYRENGPGSYSLKLDMQSLENSFLLDRAQKKPDVEGSLRQLRKRRLEEQRNTIYIPLQAKASLQASDDARFPLMENVLEFLKSDQYHVLLLLGDSGAGKSTFNKALECELWSSYRKEFPIPLHISLPSIDKPDQNMIAKQLRKLDFADSQIKELKEHREFILICDGYDECQQTCNLYTTNLLNQPDEWKAKMVISCRSEYIGADYRDRFQPGDRNQPSRSVLQEVVITPFSTKQVRNYIDQYVGVYRPLWEAHDYKDALDRIPNLKDLVGNPFLMTLLMEVLPRMMDPGQHLTITRITRVVIYDQFIEQWLERGKRRLGEKCLSPSERAAFESLSNEGFAINGIDFLKRLSVAIYKKQDGQPVVEYSRFKDEGSWKSEFFGRNDDKCLLREACPLARNGNQYRFIHRSMLEYGLSLAIFDPRDLEENTMPRPALNRRGSMDSVFSFEDCEEVEIFASDNNQEPNASSPMVWRSFVNEPPLLQFLNERAQREPVFKQQLLDYIEYSKRDKKWRIAAANAITILVRAGVQFIGTDFRGARIPGADLSYGVFDSVHLQEADMRKVNLQGAWLRQTDLSKAEMTGVQFGELPYLAVDTVVWSCAYSPDGKSFAVGLESGNVRVYSTSTWEVIRTLSDHDKQVRSVVYSPDGSAICSSSLDKTVRIWIVESGSCQHILVHAGYVYCVVYSPHGDRVASASSDKKIRLWDPATGICCQILSGHDEAVLCVAYSPKGTQIVSGSTDLTVRLWDVATGECSQVFVVHSHKIWAIAFSPQGDQVASASWDKTVRLWDVESGNCRRILQGHNDNVYDVTYSLKGDQVLSASRDGTIRVWDVQSGSCRHTLTGHTDGVVCVAYSPKGDMVASGSWDKTVRLWDISVGASRHISIGHGAGVENVKCSPNGKLIASSSMNCTIRLWDAETGTCLRTLIGHSETVFDIAFSPNGNQIGSASGDKTVRLWDFTTGTCQHVFTDHIELVYRIAYSPQGDQVASASFDKTVRLWNAMTGEHQRALSGHTDAVMSVAYSPDGNLIATSSKDRTVRLWDAGSMSCINSLEGHLHWIGGVVFSPLGDQLASASDDMSVRLWSVSTGDCCLILLGHTAQVFCVAFSRKGDLLASGSLDKTIRIWDAVSGQCRVVVRNFQGSVNGVSWIPSTDANFLVAGCADGSVLKWQVVEEEKRCHFKLCWVITKGSLMIEGISIKDVHGLTPLNKQLLKQRVIIGRQGYWLRLRRDTVSRVAHALQQHPMLLLLGLLVLLVLALIVLAKVLIVLVKVVILIIIEIRHDHLLPQLQE